MGSCVSSRVSREGSWAADYADPLQPSLLPHDSVASLALDGSLHQRAQALRTAQNSPQAPASDLNVAFPVEISTAMEVDSMFSPSSGNGKSKFVVQPRVSN